MVVTRHPVPGHRERRYRGAGRYRGESIRRPHV